jgi:hypothetical protein
MRYIGKPKQPTIAVYQLVDGEYQVSQFQWAEQVVSPACPDLARAAERVFQA